MSNLWLTNHMMEHYRFTGDDQFLKDKALPVFRDVAAFFECYIFEHQGYYSTGPSISPENYFVIPEGMSNKGEKGAIDISPTMDNSLLYDFFTSYIEIASALGISEDEDEMITKADKFRSGLRPTPIGSHGQIQEWRNDYTEMEEGHRHLSHLWDLFPGSAMSPLLNETLSDAAKVSLQRRLAAGGASTGWSSAWTAACFARLLDGDTTLEQTRTLIGNHAMYNLFHKHDGSGKFQIDSNFGIVGAIAEWFVQSHAGVVHLLPALGSDIPAGSVKGLVARGGFVVDLSWNDDGMLAEANVESTRGGTLKIRVSDGKGFKIDGQNVDTVETESGGTYKVTL